MDQFQADWREHCQRPTHQEPDKTLWLQEDCAPVRPGNTDYSTPSVPTNNFACNSLKLLSNLEIRSLIFCGFRPYTDSHRRGIACGISGMTFGGTPSSAATYVPLPPSTARPRLYCRTQAAQPATYLAAASDDSRGSRSKSGTHVLDRK